ncbi:hypothetical protein [Ruminococcus sp.]|uniref:hypothetical protein n=1 Tax=Ruminococcus sp. TaxID=41978 RepID=UPI002C8105BC|nr:hypothetical protein [Ruminococcus sp.]HNZ99291.1 hypothetical protein [Ruminococcus sp.]HOH87811.1 hypothetical protein [Ruminococcus sp.]
MEQLAKVLPKYKENIIVAVVFRNHFEWYVAPKNLWKMDYDKLYRIWKALYSKSGKSFEDFEREIGSYEEFCGKRWGIEVLNENTASHFLAHLFKCRYSADELRLLRTMARDDKKIDYTPSLYIDFDRNIMCSMFPKPENFENFVPDGWSGRYGDFSAMIPADKRF